MDMFPIKRLFDSMDAFFEEGNWVSGWMTKAKNTKEDDETLTERYTSFRQ